MLHTDSSYLRAAAIRCGIIQTAQGAAIAGVYHPPVEPYEGHGEDILMWDSDVMPRQDYSAAKWPFFLYGMCAAAAVLFGAWLAFL